MPSRRQKVLGPLVTPLHIPHTIDSTQDRAITNSARGTYDALPLRRAAPSMTHIPPRNPQTPVSRARRYRTVGLKIKWHAGLRATQSPLVMSCTVDCTIKPRVLARGIFLFPFLQKLHDTSRVWSRVYLYGVPPSQYAGPIRNGTSAPRR